MFWPWFAASVVYLSIGLGVMLWADRMMDKSVEKDPVMAAKLAKGRPLVLFLILVAWPVVVVALLTLFALPG